MSSLKCTLLTSVVLSLFVTVLIAEESVINLGNRRELFVDEFIIESLDGLKLRLHEPLREGPAFAFDKPWEGRFSAYPTIIKDGDLYRMYYRGLPDVEEGTVAVTCYAESKDGIVWTKPNLGIYEINGTKDNNVVLALHDKYSRSFSPTLDTRPGVPAERRFKAITGVEGKGLAAFISPDGIHWKMWQKEFIFTQGLFDSHNVAFWSASEGQYVCYFRTWTGEGFNGFRTISRTTSKDFLNWTDPVAMDFGDTPMEHLYTNGTQPYFRAPHIYLALAKRFFPKKAALDESVSSGLVDNPKYAIASSDSIFMSTRGGKVYDRSFMEAFIRPGDTTLDWVARDNTPALGLAEGDGRRLYIYRMSHYAQPSAHLDRYSLRLDGFVSVNASYEGGELLSKSFRFSGGELEINYESSAAGELRVELLDLNGDPILGYALDDCLPIFGNEIERVVKWKDGSDVSALAGKAVKLRIALNDADLYSFRFR